MTMIGTAPARTSEFAPGHGFAPDVIVSGPESLEISVVMPCLNEAETLARCIDAVRRVFAQHEICGEIIVADNGSSDGSVEVALSHGARVVRVKERGYGCALRGGIEAARGTYVIMGDADDSYDFGHIPVFLESLRTGYDLVMGNRFRGGIKPGAMPRLHRYLGNPVLTGIGRIFFGSPVGDFHCGLRGFSKAAYDRMGLQSPGMEFASEMVVRASLLEMNITEVPTTLSPDGRSRPAHLRTWRDGWRHLRFLLLYSPRWLFLFPGIMMSVAGLAVSLWLLPGPRTLGHVTFDIHSLMLASMLILVGYQAVTFAVFAKILGITQGMLPPDPRMDRLFRRVKLETGIAVGTTLLLLGIGLSSFAVGDWRILNFGRLDPGWMSRIVIPSVVCSVLGVEIILSSFFLSLLGLAKR